MPSILYIRVCRYISLSCIGMAECWGGLDSLGGFDWRGIGCRSTKVAYLASLAVPSTYARIAAAATVGGVIDLRDPLNPGPPLVNLAPVWRLPSSPGPLGGALGMYGWILVSPVVVAVVSMSRYKICTA